MGSVFRPALARDAAALACLAEELGYPAAPETIAGRLGRLATDPAQAVLVAENEGAVVAWLHVQEFHSLAADPCALVTGMVVTARARRTGVGRALLGQAEAWARARGLGAMRLRSRVERHDAHAFYARLGYVESKRQVQFRKDL